MYCRKEMVKILKCYLIPKKSYGTLSKGAIFSANPVFCFLMYKLALKSSHSSHCTNDARTKDNLIKKT